MTVKVEGLKIFCDACGRMLTQQGRLTFTPTENPKLFEKKHACIECALKEQRLVPLDSERLYEATVDVVDEVFPKGKCKERGKALVLYALVLIKIMDTFGKDKNEK